MTTETIANNQAAVAAQLDIHEFHKDFLYWNNHTLAVSRHLFNITASWKALQLAFAAGEAMSSEMKTERDKMSKYFNGFDWQEVERAKKHFSQVKAIHPEEVR